MHQFELWTMTTVYVAISLMMAAVAFSDRLVLKFVPRRNHQAQPMLSIGAVAVAPSDSDVVWVGTGEANDRNSSGWGDGVYRSTDGGETWQNVGIKESRTIARVVVDPKKPEVAYVAAMGDLWKDGGERGLFKTTDAGKSWKLILHASPPHDAQTGCGDIVLDPTNSQIVYAVLYARQRTPWSFSSGPSVTGGEDVGGIFKSTDGGATWKKLSGGLPGQTGRIGLAVSASNPKVVMAVVQSYEGGFGSLDDLRSKSGGVFRSEDGGETWTRMSTMNPRPFYFSQIRIDPANDQRVYPLGFALFVSDDAGTNFREDLTEKTHPDDHALAIQPGTVPPPKPPKPEEKNKPPKPQVCQRVLLGTDGGVYQSFAGGKNWDHLTKFRRVNFTESRSTTRNRISESPAAFRTMKTGWDPAPSKARKVFAIVTGLRSQVATAFTCCSTQRIATRSTPKANKAKYTGSTCKMARYGVYAPNRLRASRVIASTGIRR